MLVALDRQHFGKPAPSQNDCGASGFVRECEWSLKHQQSTAAFLSQLGIETLNLPSVVPQTYGARHVLALQRKAAPYIALHANASSGVSGNGYALVEYIDNKMRPFAEALAAAYGAALGIPDRIVQIDSTNRGWECIDGVADRGVISEPFFVNTEVAKRIDLHVVCARALTETIQLFYGEEIVTEQDFARIQGYIATAADNVRAAVKADTKAAIDAAFALFQAAGATADVKEQVKQALREGTV